MSDATIKWTCVKDAKWEWMSARDGTGISTPQELSGTVKLPPNGRYWAPCANLVLQNVTTGGAMLRYFIEAGQGVVEARTFAAPHGNDKGWESQANVGRTSMTHVNGGINLVVEIV
jgi:hypothetical protein